MDERVSIRAHYERFPATVKGAFVMRGADGDPHQVQVAAARVREIASGKAHPIDLAALTLDVAPNLDLFVPFELGVTELAPGWYGIECDVAVDGTPTTVRPGKRFAVAWPRSSVRRGGVRVGKAAQIETGPKVKIEQVDCGADSVRLTYSSAPPQSVAIRLRVDGAPHHVLETEFDEATGRGRVTAYPVLKTQARLAIEVRGVPAPIEVVLP